MHVDKKKFKKLFPNLTAELENDVMSHSINSARTNSYVCEKVSAASFEGYSPDIIDFIRRCDTNQQAEEIIKFLEARAEIPVLYANKIRKQFKEKGEEFWLKEGKQLLSQTWRVCLSSCLGRDYLNDVTIF